MASAKDDERTAPAGNEAVEPRRTALKMLVAGCGAVYAGAIAVPAAQFLAAGAEGSGGGARWLKVGRLADLVPGVPKRVRVVGDHRDAFTMTKNEELGAVWLIREGDKVRAMSATCPHLGCAVDLNPDKKTFNCPCHTSNFGSDGACQSGPSPRGMDPLETRVQGDGVEVAFKKFRQGIAGREEVG